MQNINHFGGHNHALREARKGQNLSPKEVAQRLNISCSTYLRWERNAQQPQLRHIRQLCQLFDKSIEELGYEKIFDSPPN